MPFIVHVATAEGLCVDPSKVQAIVEMPHPSEVAAVQRFLGLAQYLSKFLPHLSDITKPLRELTQKDVVWTWDPSQQQALEKLKKAVSSTPVEVLQCTEPTTAHATPTTKIQPESKVKKGKGDVSGGHSQFGIPNWGS